MGVYDYEVGERVCEKTNVHNFKLSYDNRPPENYSALYFKKVKGANSFIEALKKYQNHPNVAIPHDVILEKDGTGAYAVMETLSSFRNWAVKVKKKGMWDVVADKQNTSVCLGLGDTLKTIFTQLGSALTTINADGVVLNDFWKGVMFGTDGQVRIFNFFLNKSQGRSQAQAPATIEDATIEEAKAHAVYDDISKFVKFLKEVADCDLPLATNLSKDIQNLEDLLSSLIHKPKTMTEIKKLMKWIHNAPMFWNNRKILILFKLLGGMYKENKPRFVKWHFYHRSYKNWRTDILGNSGMKNCFRHKKRQHHNYNVVESFLWFIRNFLEHPPAFSTEFDAYYELLLLFPELLGKTWNEMFTIRDKGLIILGGKSFVGTFDDYIEVEPSIFQLDKPK